MTFTLTARDGRARAGILRTAHGPVETPVFMPVATQASVKALSSEDLAGLGAQAILANAYHLYLRPGMEVLEAGGGLHRFMSYPGAILTDSGGFQIFSLSGLRQVTDEGVTFQSHLDGSRHTLTPEGVIGLQARIGSDIWTSLDECPPYPCAEARAREALQRTAAWTERSHRAFLEERERRGAAALFFPILQGSIYPALRREAAERLGGMSFDGAALGGFSVGEPKEMTWEALSETTRLLPEEKPRYLMGMGTPEDLWQSVGLGVDMLDCVWPTRVARNGLAMLRRGRLNIENSALRGDFSPLDPDCGCPVCSTYTRAYLSHLYRARELAAYRLLTLHNLHLLFATMREIRAAIREGRFEEARRGFLGSISETERDGKIGRDKESLERTP